MKTVTYIAEHGTVTTTVHDVQEMTLAENRLSILRSTLVIYCTGYDAMIKARAARNPRVYHNVFALSLYFEAVERVVDDVRHRVGVQQALRENFTGHMLTYLLRKVAR